MTAVPCITALFFPASELSIDCIAATLSVASSMLPSFLLSCGHKLSRCFGVGSAVPYTSGASAGDGSLEGA